MTAVFLSGLLTALSLPFVLATPWGYHPFPDMGWVVWFSLVPLYLTLSKASSGRAFWLGLGYGFVHFGMTLYWIVIAMHRYGEVPLWGSFLGLGLAVFFMALFPAVVSWGAVFLRRRGLPFSVAWVLLFIVLEYARNFFPFGGFSWSSLAYSQRSFLSLIQILDIAGLYGILLLILLSNVVLGEWMRWMFDRKSVPVKWTAAFIFLGVSALLYGHFRLFDVQKNMKENPVIKVGLVQGNIPQDEKWVSERIEEIIAHHMTLTKKLQAQKPDLIFWPEAAFPAVLPPEVNQIEELKDLNTPLLMGIVRYEGILPEDLSPQELEMLPEASRFRLYNSAILLKSGGWIEGRYDKVHLVPMGEYVPLQGLFTFLHQIAPSMGTFTSGGGFHLLALTPGPSPTLMWERGAEDEERVRFGVTICYEDLFPEISRTFTRQGAEFLVNLTNDGWYDQSSAVFQHFDFSRYRAIENRRSLIRVTNTGVTAVFDATGAVIPGATLPPFQEGTLIAQVPVGGVSSFYTDWGDLLPWGCFVILVLLIGLIFIRRRHVERNS